MKRFNVATGQLQTDRNLNLGLPYLSNAMFSVDGNIAISPDGQQLAIATGIGPPSPISIWDAKSGLRLFDSFAPDSEVGNMSFSPDRKKLAAGGYDGNVYLRDVQVMPESIDLPGKSGR